MSLRPGKRSAVAVFRSVVVAPITFYQRAISPLKPSTCIYYPTCSHYAKEAVLEHGVLAGLLLGTLRILRCVGLLYSGGADPVPERITLGYLFGSFWTFFRYRRRSEEHS